MGDHDEDIDHGKILPGNHARGWNDPPQFTYDAQNPSGAITASNPLATNKRVGHDFCTNKTSRDVPTDNTSGAAPAFTAPSALTGLGHVPILNMPPKELAAESSAEEKNVSTPDITDDKELCQYCVRCFTECTDRLQNDGDIEGRVAKDVVKRIGIFEKGWMSGKLSSVAKPNCAKLARALELSAYKAADEIHLKLMTDHVSEVSQWMVGVKKLIQAGRTK